MREITQDNYTDLEYKFEGIVIGVPIVALEYNADFYFIKQKVDYDNDTRYYIMCGYNQEDETINGIAPDRLTSIENSLESVFNAWGKIKYYQFDNLLEFCNWYLTQDDKLKESVKKFKQSFKVIQEENDKTWIQEKCGTNLPPNCIPEKPSCNCHKKHIRREQLKDVLKLLELRDIRQNTVDMLTEDMSNEKRDYLCKQLDRDNARIEDFLNEVI